MYDVIEGQGVDLSSMIKSTVFMYDNMKFRAKGFASNEAAVKVVIRLTFVFDLIKTKASRFRATIKALRFRLELVILTSFLFPFLDHIAFANFELKSLSENSCLA